MHAPDFEPFRAVLDDLARTLRADKARPAWGVEGTWPLPDDAEVQRYWAALKDLPLEVVKARASTAVKRLRWFPKPADLRPPAEKFAKADADPAERKRYEGAVRFGVENWKRLLNRSESKPTTRWLLLDAYIARTEQLDRDDLVFAERMAWAREVGARLLAEHGEQVLRESWAAWSVAVQLWPHKAVNALPMIRQERLDA